MNEQNKHSLIQDLEDVNKNEARRMYRIHCTVLEMIKDRGFVSDVVKEEDIVKFRMKYSNASCTVDRQQMNFVAHHKDDKSKRVLVHFMSEKSIGINFFKDIVSYISQNCIYHLILIGGKVSPTSKKAIFTTKSKYHVELFLEEELLVNITQHQLVPQHIVISSEEKQLILKRYHLTEDKMPRISRYDPVARYYGMLPGQVCKIIRPSETAGRYLVYRICF